MLCLQKPESLSKKVLQNVLKMQQLRDTEKMLQKTKIFV